MSASIERKESTPTRSAVLSCREAIAEGFIAVTPVHFDLTDRTGMDELTAFDLGSIVGSIGKTEGETSPAAS